MNWGWREGGVAGGLGVSDPLFAQQLLPFVLAHSEQIDFLPLWPLTRLSSALPRPLYSAADDLVGVGGS